MTEDVLDSPEAASAAPAQGQAAGRNGQPAGGQNGQPAAAPRAFQPPLTETEQAVARIWAGVLGRERVGASDDFFEIGGDSLKAQRVLSLVEREMGVSIPIRTAYASPTVAQLSMHIDRAKRIVMTEEEELINIINGLSDEEVHALLGDAMRQSETDS